MLVWWNVCSVHATAYIALNPQPIVQVCSQNSTVKQEDHILKHGCDLTDVLETCRFTLLVKSLQWNRKIQCGNSLRQILTLMEIIGAIFILFGVGIWALYEVLLWWCCKSCVRLAQQLLQVVPTWAFPFDALFLWERFSLYNTVLISEQGYRFQRTLSVRAFSLCAWRC